MENEKQIVWNAIKTPDGTIIESRHRHDYVTHEDKNGLVYMVDGGNEYLRRNIHKEAPHEEISLYLDSPFELVREKHCRGGRGKDGLQPLTWVPLSKMSDEWLQNCVTYNEANGNKDSVSTLLYKKELDYRFEKNISIEY